MLSFLRKKTELPASGAALRGREVPIATADIHFVNNRPLKEPYPDGMRLAMFGMGCFWGVERMFWNTEGVWVTSVGYAGGETPNPTYREICTGMTGHNEVVRVVYDPKRISFGALLRMFWESHDPTQGMRQGNDVGTQYRSGIYCYEREQTELALASRREYETRLENFRFGAITTEILDAPTYYFAEDYHQQYLAKNPGGYCALRGTGISFACN